MSKFFTLHQLIQSFEFDHSSLANYIEMNGVFGCDIEKNIDIFDADSTDVENALRGIANDLQDRKSRVNFGDEWESVAGANKYRHAEQGPTHYYGWPEDKVPDPLKCPASPNWIESKSYTTSFGIFIGDSRIYTIGRLLVTRKATPAEIATEIEKSGIHGFDDYDRLKLITFDLYYDDSLGVLAKWTKFLKGDDSLRSSVFDDVRLKNYGWPRGQLPSFSGVPKGYGLTKEETDHSTKVVEQSALADADDKINSEKIEYLSNPSERQSYQVMIGSLIAYIQHHNKSVKKADLLRWINDNIKIRGAKRTKAMALFREGEAILKEITQLLKDHDVYLPEDAPHSKKTQRSK